MARDSLFTPIGIDIGTADLKCAQFKRAEGAVRAWRLARLREPLPADGAAARRQFASELAAFLRSSQFRGRRVVVSLPSSRLDLVSLTVPVGSEDESGVIRAEVQSHLGYPVEDAVVDSVRLAGGQGRAANRQDVLVAAARRTDVESLLHLLHQARLDVQAVDVPPTALSRLASSLLRSAGAGPRAVVDIGALQSTAVVTDNGELACCRRIPLGGSHFTALLVKGLEVSEADAEQIKCHQGGLSEPAAHGEAAVRMHEVLAAILRPKLEEFTEELQRLLRYFAAQTRGRQVEQILLVGGSSRLEQLKAAVHQATQLSTASLDDLDGESVSALRPEDGGTSEPLSLFAVAAGLALRDGHAAEARRG